MLLSIFKKTNLHLSILFSVLCFILVSCGSGGSSKKTPTAPEDPAQTTFQFQFETPSFAAAKGVQLFANEEVLVPTIQVAIVDGLGRITQIVEPIEIIDYGNGLFSVVLPGGERLDCIVIAPLAGRPDLQVGDLINPSTSIFTPTTDSSNVATVNVTSSVAYDIFLDTIDSFDNIGIDELDEILDAAQASIDEGSLGSGSIAELIAAIKIDIESQVLTQTVFANSSPETPNSGGGSSIAADQATIKAFFDDLNILNILKGEMSNSANAPLIIFSEHAKAAQQALETSEGALDALTAINGSIDVWFNDLESLPTEPTTITIDGDDIIFNTDPNASELTGSVTYSQDSVEVNLEGTYNASGLTTTLTDLNFSLDLSKNNYTGSLGISGSLDTDDAKLEIITGQITTSGDEPNSKILSDSDVDNQAFMDGLVEAALSLNVRLTAKDVEPDHNMVLEGLVEASVIRSSNLYIEYDAPDGGFTSEGEVYFNPSIAHFNGELEYKGEKITLDIALDSDSAASYVPNRTLLAGFKYSGLTYNNAPLATYFWNGTDTFELKFAEQTYTIKKLPRVGDDFDVQITNPDGYVYVFHPYYDSFEQYLTIQGNYYFELEGFGNFCFGLSNWNTSCNTLAPLYELVRNAETSAPVFLEYEGDGSIDSEDNYRDIDLKATITATLDTLGETTVYFEHNQTGLNLSIDTLLIKNIENAQLQSKISITALLDQSLEDEEQNYVITNDRGFVIRKSDIDELDTDKFEIRFGLATAIVELLEFGLKVSYPNGDETEFTIY